MILTLFSHCSEEERVSAYDIASKRSNWQRAGGWKLQRFALQLDEMVCSSLFLLTTCKFITLLRLSSPLPLLFPLHSYTLAPFFSPSLLSLSSFFLLTSPFPPLSSPSHQQSKVEGDILETMERLQSSVDNLGQCRSCDTDTSSDTDNTQLLKSCSELVKVRGPNLLPL